MGDASTLKIYAPYTTVINKVTGDKFISSITVKVNEGVNAQIAEKSLSELLEIKHGKKDFFTRNSDSIKQTIEETISTMRLLISSIAVVSLVAPAGGGGGAGRRRPPAWSTSSSRRVWPTAASTSSTWGWDLTHTSAPSSPGTRLHSRWECPP